MWARLSAFLTHFTVRSACQYCCLYLFFSLSDLVFVTFFIRDLVISMARLVYTVIQSSLFFLSAFQASFASVCIGYSGLLSQVVDVASARRCMFFSICQCLILVLQLDGEGTHCSGSFRFITLNDCCLSLSGPFLLSLRFRVAVTGHCRHRSAPFLCLTFCNDLLHVLLIIRTRWSTGCCLFH